MCHSLINLLYCEDCRPTDCSCTCAHCDPDGLLDDYDYDIDGGDAKWISMLEFQVKKEEHTFGPKGWNKPDVPPTEDGYNSVSDIHHDEAGHATAPHSGTSAAGGGTQSQDTLTVQRQAQVAERIKMAHWEEKLAERHMR